KDIRLCFLWHMHQPYYTDPVSGSASMPWVRLHATKAYFDMAFLMEKFPDARATFNFTPSLLLQLEELGSGNVVDLFWEHAARPAAELTPPEKAFLIRHFFSANWATMVRPFPRYHELLVKRGTDVHGQDLDKLARQFSSQDLLDLQVWHNLAWFGFGALSRYPRLAALRQKNRHFTEEEKREVLDLQRSTVQAIVPMYRRLAELDQIELTTTPFFHPILPLVIDTEFTRRARPDLPLPARFRAPADAEAQITRAVDYHDKTFGRAPVGLWPAEGSVCPEMIPLLRKAGVRWCATDEGILARSFHVAGRHWNRSQDLYRPYVVEAGEQSMVMVFRDRELSDNFGFVYHKTTPDSAADDVLRRIRGIAMDAPGEHAILSVILDGENPWEHYHDGGERFLSLLYRAFSGKGFQVGEGTRVGMSTMSSALDAMPATHRLTQLHSGSWINQDYKIWIGHSEDNRGWDLLHHTRGRLVEITPTLTPQQAEGAWTELYAAEGSDWFWWYGDDFDTDYKQEFDRLFRTHLRNVWTRAGMTPPQILNQTLIEYRSPPQLDSVRAPVALLSPQIDGMETNFFEWRGAGSINPNPPLGAMWKSEGIFTGILFGSSRDTFYLRLDPDERASSREAHLSVDLHLTAAEHMYKLSISLDSTRQTDARAWRMTSSGEPEPTHFSGMIRRRVIIEIAVPYKDVPVDVDQPMRVTVVVLEHNLEVARYPYHNPVIVTRPGDDFEATMWRV
ncbi:MAG TPA: glycoside hydrolase family 57 protein, partial [Nitrospiraceae bacterium]|nr:glycoside hydrolase family 57 protein [Nitrospiraceae bacterium]